MLSAGIGAVVPTMTSALLGSVDRTRSVVSSDTLNTARQTGSVIGVALFGSLLGTDLAHGLRWSVMISVALSVVVGPRTRRRTRSLSESRCADRCSGRTGRFVDTGPMERRRLLARYEQYLAACNDRRWDELGRHVADEVLVNGEIRSRAEYVHDIQALIATFPDYRWELTRALVDDDWLAVHLRDTGTRMGDFGGAAGNGVEVSTDEFAMYRMIDGLIVEIEGTADNARLMRRAQGSDE